MSDSSEELCYPTELYDEELETREIRYERGISVTLQCAPDHLQMNGKSAYLVVWPASLCMANFLINQISAQSSDRRIRVLELGAGVGACGLALAKLSEVALVVLTDGDEDVLKQLRISTAVDCVARAERLFWGDEKEIQCLKDKYLQEEQEGFDIIVGTDVTYTSKHIESLLYTANKLIRQSGTLYLSYSMPRFAQFEDQTFEMANKHGFEVVEQIPPVPPSTSKIVQFRMKQSH